LPELSTGHSSQNCDWTLFTTNSTVLHGTQSCTKIPTFWENLSFILRQGQQSRTCMYCSFFTDPLTTWKRYLAFLQRHNTPDHDFVRLCDKIFTPHGQVLQVGILHSDVFYAVPKLCFIRESHFCRSLYFEKCPSRIFFIQYEIFLFIFTFLRKLLSDKIHHFHSTIYTSTEACKSSFKYEKQWHTEP
jgi:hypothetical protein